MRILISTLALGIALASTSAAQIVVTQEAPAAGQDKAQDAKQEASPEALNVFYKAFWLERGARKLDDAVSHYKKFLAMAPKSEHAPRAARSLVNLLYRDDKVEDAQAAEKQFAALLAQAPAGPAGGPGAGAGRGAGRPEGAPPRGAGQGGQRPGRDMSATIERLEKQIADAKAAGDDDNVEKLQRRLENVKAAAERGAGAGAGEGGQGRRGAGGAGGGRMGGRQMKPLNEMTKEEATQWIERMEGFLDRMLERMPEDRAAEMEKGFKEMKSLVEAGKLEEAEKIRAKVMTFGRRRN
ncbi:MAG: hypothetical protein KDC95_02610 [Planctomycetes bacterium]|nr:hypothetical protein [Planctomycetota bacterium]